MHFLDWGVGKVDFRQVYHSGMKIIFFIVLYPRNCREVEG